MKYLKLYESFDFNEDDFDFEEDYPINTDFKYVKLDGLEWIYILIGNTLFNNYSITHLKGYINIIPLTKNEIKEMKDRNLPIHYKSAVNHTSLRYSEFIKKYPQFAIHLKLYENFDFNEDDFDFEEEQPYDIDDILNVMPEKFLKFLIQNDALETYCENLSKSKNGQAFVKTWINYKNLFNGAWTQYLNDAFPWTETLQKHDYWASLHRKWYKLTVNS